MADILAGSKPPRATGDTGSPASPVGDAEEAPDEVEPEAGEESEPTPGRQAAIVPAGGPLAPHDALQRYMAEVARHPLLSREEEDALARRYRADPEHNVDAAYALVTANLRLVVKIAYQYRRAAFNLLDLVQEGNIGLMQAVKKFDPGRGIKLSSYAAWWIRAYILRFIMDNFRLVKLGTTAAQRKLFFNLKKEQERLAAQGIAAGPKLLAERLDVSEEDVVEMQGRLGQEELSLDVPVGEEQKDTHLDRLTAAEAGAEERLGDAELRERFHEKLRVFAEGLQGRERYIYEKRLIAEEPLTLQEIGDKYHLTRERARQLEAELTRRLRDFIAAEMPDFAEVSLSRPPRTRKPIAARTKAKLDK